MINSSRYLPASTKPWSSTETAIRTNRSGWTLCVSIKIDTEANAAETWGLNLSFVRGLVLRI